jgi:diaminohydroxyphosphoribosylaminopyrimidine deaminase/5-amino-6-(5-phosphoribosylamino)uracil reductase
MQPGQRTLVYTSNKASSQWLQALKARQIETEILKTHHGYFAIQEILQSLGKRQIAHLLVEGGNQVLGQFLEQKSINRVHAYLAPKILGSNGLSPLDTQTSLHLSDCPPLHNRTVSDVGEDILISCETLQTPRDYQEFLTSQRNTSHV